ncbi:hypothetical protein [Candidatus Schmidhempelia bombi]|nr:hypothetical protein [Candidatus Schmidhempelia bombi]
MASYLGVNDMVVCNLLDCHKWRSKLNNDLYSFPSGEKGKMLNKAI